MWFLVAIIGYFLLAIVLLLDKIIVSESRVRPIVYTFYSTIIALPSLAVVPFLGNLSTEHWGVAILSGFTFGLGLWGTFHALEHDEASHIGPFGGALIAVSIALLSFFVLRETLSYGQVAGVTILVFASLLLSYEKTRGKAFHRGFFWAIIAAVFFAVSHVSAKYLYELYPFALVLFATKGTVGFLGILCFFSSDVRQALRFVSTKKKKNLKQRHPFFLVACDKVVGIAGVILIQYAVSVGSVTLVNALAGVQYILLFFLVVFFTRFFPRIFREYITKREYAVQLIAVLLAALGSVFVVL